MMGMVKTIMFVLIFVVVVEYLTGCAQVAQTVGSVDPRLGELSNNILGIKNYRYEHVEGEPDQRLIVIRGSELVRRLKYKDEAMLTARPLGVDIEILGQKDYPDKHEMKVVVWCRK